MDVLINEGNDLLCFICPFYLLKSIRDVDIQCEPSRTRPLFLYELWQQKAGVSLFEHISRFSVY